MCPPVAIKANRPMLLHPIRTLFLVTIAFVAGMVYERTREAERCVDRAGVLSDLLCEDQK
ncbi:hypothetical protein [Planktotalea sp.]|uniref:hypothetical protein n=1 Tax=Planktotalea sp. TaxID=2029877 RepID=UPI003D6AC6DF